VVPFAVIEFEQQLLVPIARSFLRVLPQENSDSDRDAAIVDLSQSEMSEFRGVNAGPNYQQW